MDDSLWFDVLHKSRCLSARKVGKRELKEKGDEFRESVRLLVESAEPSALTLYRWSHLALRYFTT